MGLNRLFMFILMVFHVTNGCVLMWNASPNTKASDICPVTTTSGQSCSFPFTYNNKTYSTCTIGGPSNPSQLPQCITSSGSWSVCSVPTTSTISFVTTKTGGSSNDNSASTRGGTLVWIYGRRFAKNTFSTSPTSSTSNQVVLQSQYASYNCDLHIDKTTETQITCYTQAMPESTYIVIVSVNGVKIPFYQYSDYSSAVIRVSLESTPFIANISPARSIPNSFVSIQGNFKTECYSRDVAGCSDDGDARITRVFFGPQLCDLINQTTNAVYFLNSTKLNCKLSGTTVALFNASMLVSENYGRAQLESASYYVTPNELIYNYQTYAEIDSITPMSGSTEGGTDLTITGKYLFHSSSIPAHVTVGTKKCTVTGFDNNDQLKSTIKCQTEKDTANLSENIGNRGIVITRDNVFTSYANLGLASPSLSATVSWNDETSYIDDKTVDVTIWFTGFLAPGISSNYEFSIESNGITKLYLSTDSTKANVQQVASYDLITNSKSSVFLNASSVYYLNAISSRKGGNLTAKINAKMLDSSLNSYTLTNKIKTEIQEIVISSTIVPESSSLAYGNSIMTNGTSEVQILVIGSPNLDDIMLSFDGANTRRLSYGSSANEVKEALNDLPTLYGTYVDVNATSDANGNLVYTVVFSPHYGDVPAIKEVLGLVSFTNTESVKGIASNQFIQIKIQNAYSPLIDPANDNITEIHSKVEELFGIRCPSSISRPQAQSTAVIFDYENECQPDEQPLDQTAFCGYCSRNNNDELFKGLTIPLSYNQLCFAYKVISNPISKLSYNLLIDGETSVWTSSQIETIADGKWHYTCVDVYQDSLYSMNTDSGTYPKTRLTLLSAYVYPAVSDLYIDTVSLKNKFPVGYGDAKYESLRRIIPTLQLVYNTLNISRDSVNSKLVLSYRPNNCTINLNTTEVRQTNAAIVSKLTSSSGPVTGSFNLTWMGTSLGIIQADSSDYYVKNLLQAVKGLENVKVVRSQDCAGFKWIIQWFYGGNRPQMQILSQLLSGNSPAVSVNTIVDGGVEFYPIPGDMLRTVSSQPQVSVIVNGISSKCANTCSFQYASLATPTVNTITVSSGTVNISGSGFDGINLSNNLVFIGTTSCNVTLATFTSISCLPDHGPVGTYSFKVQILGKGYAIMNSNTQYTFPLVINSFSPLVVGSGGGVALTIVGSGFSKQSKVAIDNINCPIQSVSYNSITCLTPTNPTNSDKLANIVVTDGSSTSIAVTQLTIDNTNVPQVTSVNPSNGLSVLGGQVLTITGSGFNTSLKQVMIGTKLAIVQSINSTSIVIISPEMSPGQYQIIIPSGPLGNAKVTTLLEYTFYVASFTPSIGSIRGGTLVTIYGEGFNTNCSLNEVSFGTAKCSIQSCTTHWIQCKTSSAYHVHKIDNKGINQNYGTGYQWNHPNININRGDTVEWTWSPPGSVLNVKYMIEQVQDPTSTIPAGFSSGTQSSSGSYSYQFNKEGTYYYWSGYVDSSNTISLRGVINVGPTTDLQEELKIFQGTVKAQTCVFPFTYNGQSYSSCTTTNFGYSWCSPSKEFTGQVLKCATQSQPVTSTCPGSSLSTIGCTSITTPKPYHMDFVTCNVPQMTLISTLNGTLNSQITISGTGFSSNSCENSIIIGDYSCPIIQSSSTSITCQIGTGSGLLPNARYPIEVNIANIGNVIQNSWYRYKHVPSIISITPTVGSQFGGTLVTISGDGFDSSNTIVLLDNTPVVLSSITYDKITFTTEERSVGIKSIEIRVNSINAKCSVSSGLCTYEYSFSIAPTLSSVASTSVSGSSTITITGTNFGTIQNAINVLIGTQSCIVSIVTSTSLTCSVSGIALGPQSISLTVDGVGSASSRNGLSVTGISTIGSISPNSGSVYGGTLVTISGNGFDKVSNTVVLVGNQLCNIKSVSISQIQCLTPSGSGINTVSIVSNNIQYPTISFTYDSSLTPQLLSISPTSGTTSQSITLTGTGFGSIRSAVSVDIGGAACIVTSLTNSQVQCIAGSNIAGSYDVVIRVDNNGYSNNNVKFTYNLVLSSLSNSQSSYAGGLPLTLTGQGFNGLKSQITICSVPCTVSSAVSSIQVTCQVPAQTYASTDKNCNVEITENGVTVSLPFKYVSSLTPTVSNLSPNRGGTAGGTLITITGTGFPLTKSDVIVTIAGSNCQINTLTSTIISCYTGSYSQSSIKALVQVFVNNIGNALNQASVGFEYIDLWSSVYTWGGQSVPQEGELVLIGPGQTIYFDTVTPVLKGVIIQGGSLIFEDSQNVNLNAEYVIITDNGLLQVGTETKPFTHKATITMYGSLRSIELPIYGSKVIALRNGTLDLHGKPVGVTWTYLGVTASASSNSIQLMQSVDWSVGSKIVIATTGDMNSMGESEVKIIKSISLDKKTLTLDSPLKFTHLSESRIVSGVTVHKRAEVGLLSRNVVFNAINDNSWNSLRSANACPDGFDPGEFATMTCYLGRYGDEIGSDEFGATIMINSPVKNQFGAESVIARFSNVELTHVGQAFRLGRYPIHFHLIGDSPSSYVKECAIYESFNRAVNIHGTNYIRVERTVIYNIMGGAFFLEDGVEHGNVYDGNLAVYVKVSSSGINEDGTPAAFWATNPNNTYINNAVAGGTHFGFWYRLLEHSEGPSFDPNYCPRKQPFGRFFNNTAHSIGRFGLWIFPSYTPTVTGACTDRIPAVAKFEEFTSYGCDKGAEWVEAGPLQFNSFTVYDHASAGIETKTIANHDNINPKEYIPLFYSESKGPLISDSIIIGNSDPAATASTSQNGLIIAWERGQLIKNVTFINFPNTNSYAIGETIIVGRCMFACGGWETQFSALKFINVQHRTIHRWNWDVVMKDLDGTLSGTPGALVLYNGNITSTDTRCQASSSYFQGTVCQHKNHIRFAFNNLNSDNVILVRTRNEKNSTDDGFKFSKRLTHKSGFMMSIEVNQSYFVEFDQYNYPTNISYTAGFYSIKPGDWIIIVHEMNKKPDQVKFSTILATESSAPLSYQNNQNFDWYWDNTTRHISYLIYNKASSPIIDYSISFSAKKCRYERCIMPGQPAQRPPATSRPANALFWSNASTWQNAPIGYGGNYGGGQFGLPKDNDTVIIQEGDYIVVDVKLPKLKRLQIDGYLEFDDTLDNTLSADEIFINGGQLIIGWESKPFQHKAEIILTGTRAHEELILPNGFDNMGNKAIGVYGGISFHGLPRQPSWTRLAKTAQQGTNILSLIDAVDWQPNEEIVLSTTSYSPWQTETFKILSISTDNKTLTLNSTLSYTHIADSETYPNGKSYSVSAGVGLLTRNIKIIGGEYNEQWNEKMGSRIIVTDYSYDVYPDGITTPTTIYYKGYARLNDVEFIHGGQASRNADDDYKSAILYSNLGTYDNKRPSYVRNCAFHNGFAGAIEILGSASIPIENNVLHHTIDFAMSIEGDSNIIRRNLMTLNVWAPTYSPQLAPFDVHYYGAVTTDNSKSIVFEDNLIAGSERIGLLFKGSPCPGLSAGKGLNHSITRNHIYGSVSGVNVFPGKSFETLNCVQISGFTLYKNIYWGIYYHATPNYILEDNVFVDNGVAIFNQIMRPISVFHEFENKYFINRNNLFVGRSVQFDCVNDVTPNQIVIKYSAIASAPKTPTGGRIGAYGSNFVDGSNGAPKKPWRNIMTYNAIGGLTTIENTTFARYGTQCNGEIDSAITNSATNDDGQHPIVVRGLSFYFCDNSSKIFFFRPNRDKVNPSDCVDMDCDGLKKNLITDQDGTLLGSRGAVISQSEYGWGSQERGIGDYRVPMPVLSAPNGTMLPASSVYSKPGIVRDENLCSYRSDWQAYECHGLDYRMLIIESMDVDTETRRLSPVAILSDNKYIDLINGPQDHGWCNGYTCQRRVSTFMALVAANKSYDVYLSSTPPNTLRFRILNADSNFKIRLSMYYFTSNSVNAYKGSTLVDPTNFDRSKGYLVLKDPSVSGTNYMPQIGDSCGTNFMSRTDKKLYFSLDGTDYVDLKISPEVFVNFGVPAQTADTFFQSSNVVNNIATLLGVPSNMIRRVQLVSANNATRVARQIANSIAYIQVVIADDPITNGNDTSAYDSQVLAIQQITARIVNQAHIGFLQQQAQQLFNLTIDSVTYDQTPSDVKTNSSILNRQIQIEQIFKIVTIQEFSGCRAQSPCDQQAILAVQDKYGNVITNIGASGFPWTIKASVYNSSSLTSIILQSEAQIVNGYAKFTNLGLSHSTSSFNFEFSFGSIMSLTQNQLQPYSINTAPTAVSDPILRGLALDLAIITEINKQFSLRFSIADQKSGIQIPNIAWKGLTWTSKLSLFPLSMWQANGTLNATLTQVSLSPLNGIASFNNLSIDLPGMYLLKSEIYSSDGSYNLITRSNVVRVLATGQSISTDASSEPSIKFVFEGDYDVLDANGELQAYKAMFYNYLVTVKKATVTSDIYVYKGSVAFAFDISTQTSVLSSLSSDSNTTNSSILPGLTIKYISLFDNTYNVSASQVQQINSQPSSSSSSDVGGIVGGVIGGLAAVALVAVSAGLLYKYKLKGKDNNLLNKEEKKETIEPKMKKEAKPVQIEGKQSNQKKRLLNDDVANDYLVDAETKFYNESVTISREITSPTINMALPNTIKPTTTNIEKMSRENTRVSMSDIDVL